jgi:hypothetical protein
MKIFGGLGFALLLVCGCGDLGSRAEARVTGQICDELCGWPDECFTQLDVSLDGADCVQTCEAQGAIAGFECVSAISSTIACLGTCDFESLSQEQLRDCQDEALEIESACE